MHRGEDASPIRPGDSHEGRIALPGFCNYRRDRLSFSATAKTWDLFLGTSQNQSPERWCNAGRSLLRHRLAPGFRHSLADPPDALCCFVVTAGTAARVSCGAHALLYPCPRCRAFASAGSQFARGLSTELCWYAHACSRLAGAVGRYGGGVCVVCSPASLLVPRVRTRAGASRGSARGGACRLRILPLTAMRSVLTGQTAEMPV